MTMWDARKRQSWQEHAQDAYDTTVDYVDDYHAVAWAIEDCINELFAPEHARIRDLMQIAYDRSQPRTIAEAAWREMSALSRVISQAQYEAYMEFRAVWAW